ncbi:MAG TPA: hypothetical protein VN372_07910 [Methanospirillum sp.]|nr:hypothetical protein [Methanospirillum sp.]
MAGMMYRVLIMSLLIATGLLVSAGAAGEITSPKQTTLNTGSPLVEIKADSDYVEIGDEIHLIGMLDPTLITASRSDAVILISAPEGSLADTFVLSPPNRDGLFKYGLTADVGGRWGFEALYTGIYSGRIEVEAIPSAEAKTTTLTLSGWPAYPKVGEDVSFRGRLTDSTGKGIANREIVYEFATTPIGCIAGCGLPDMVEYRPGGSERTDIGGEYSFILPVIQEGGVKVRTAYAGDEQYTTAESREISITAMAT